MEPVPEIQRWIFYDFALYRAVCYRCGAKDNVPYLPISVTDMCDWLGRFTDKHKDCKEQPDA